ncbi:MAG: sigma-70 family RNA polymerase sigma factor [Verrucomicrobiae bacterium]|nr:sigma-70 family RNA polymerase sigma factor [Verrucomicrobiae bacterium]MDW7979120.1 sigma-70 family RNA polymerase sigma factor [Verrucomicrobiales bacterium]
MDPTDQELIAAVRAGRIECFEPLVRKYSPRLFATARRYARRDSDVEDIVQEIWVRAYQKLYTYRATAPFEHWLMRIAVRVCYDFLRAHQRSRESAFSELSQSELDWLERVGKQPESATEQADAARELVQKLLDRLSPSARLVITLLAIEGRSVKEVARLTGWSVPAVKVRAFRARAELRRLLARMATGKYL